MGTDVYRELKAAAAVPWNRHQGDAEDLVGACAGEGGWPAYTRLQARVPKRPGGKLGKWFSWSGSKTICESGFG